MTYLNQDMFGIVLVQGLIVYLHVFWMNIFILSCFFWRCFNLFHVQRDFFVIVIIAILILEQIEQDRFTTSFKTCGTGSSILRGGEWFLNIQDLDVYVRNSNGFYFSWLQMVGLPDFISDLKSGPFANQPLFDHSKSRRVWISDPHRARKTVGVLRTSILQKRPFKECSCYCVQ